MYIINCICQQLIFSSIMERLKDPLNNRVIKALKMPQQKPLPSHLLFVQNSINFALLIKFLKEQGRITFQDFKTIIRRATNIFKCQPNLIRISQPANIVGDIHGQYYDFLRLLGDNPLDKNKKHLFLGDYVDRGNFSVQVIIAILSMKIIRPKNTIILRGNHQCRSLTQRYGFRNQCLAKYNQQIYDLIMEMFDSLPLACLVNGSFLCMHGGISHQIQTLKDIQHVDRFQETPSSGVLCDLLWADPIQNENGESQTAIVHNKARQCSFRFGIKVAKPFFQHNNIITIIRSHEPQDQGYKFYRWDKKKKFPNCITVFSAPNYCNSYNNKGAIIKFQNNLLNIQQFTQSPHPFILKDNQDGITFYMPHLIYYSVQVISCILSIRKSRQGHKFQQTIIQKELKKLAQIKKQQSFLSTKLVQFNGYVPQQKLSLIDELIQKKYERKTNHEYNIYSSHFFS